jgi:hypothetical protein
LNAPPEYTMRNTVNIFVIWAFTLLSSPAHAQATSGSSQDLSSVTVTAPRPPTPEELAGEAVPNFVMSHVTPSTVIGQVTRWRKGICPVTNGLSAAMNAFVTARLLAVAEAVGAPHETAPNCKSNVQILFSLEPQQLLDALLKKDSRLLGFHYPQQEKRLATVDRPIQGWYVTSTRNYAGLEIVDDAMPFSLMDGSIALQGKVMNAGKVPPGKPGSRLTDLRTSQVVLALIVVDARKVEGMTIGSIADYLAMLTLSQARSADKCSQLPSIMDLMASGCDNGKKPDQMTAGDLAFLRALYSANLETVVEIEASNIENQMMREFTK